MAAAAQGTVYVWLGSASHVTTPELPILITLYWITDAGAKLTALNQSGLLLVYLDGSRARALAVFQLPRAGELPTLCTWSGLIPMIFLIIQESKAYSLTVSPNIVVTSPLKVTETEAKEQDGDAAQPRLLVHGCLFVYMKWLCLSCRAEQ